MRSAKFSEFWTLLNAASVKQPISFIVPLPLSADVIKIWPLDGRATKAKGPLLPENILALG